MSRVFGLNAFHRWICVNSYTTCTMDLALQLTRPFPKREVLNVAVLIFLYIVLSRGIVVLNSGTQGLNSTNYSEVINKPPFSVCVSHTYYLHPSFFPHHHLVITMEDLLSTRIVYELLWAGVAQTPHGQGLLIEDTGTGTVTMHVRQPHPGGYSQPPGART